MKAASEITTPGAEADASVLAGEFAALLGGIQRAARRRVRRELGLEPLSGAQVELLRLVASQPGIGVSAAARELRLAGNSVSALVNQLSAGGYLIRSTDPVDRRAAHLSASPAGLDRLARWSDRRTALFAELIGGLSSDDAATVAAALPALRRIADRLMSSTALPGDDPGEDDFANQGSEVEGR
jgi:DNA-binding MarR family transcriptional regulator